ncbi:hypothetical protein [Psychrobacter lutiphocae]|uniref:hypothetical protein n=1 Tax=Psychrobacter lutiphocae TaxID=540500 RepID=UPI00035C79C0|nr:hypothetical protein [Psychrobacter lutiphocae]
MKNHWLFWGFWVLLNALASFVWGNLVLASKVPALLGMLAGIAVFIVVYGLVDAYFIKKGYLKLHQALRRSVYIKAVLQLLNIFVIFGISISLELWAGIISVGITDKYLGINQMLQPFGFAFINTLLTGTILSLVVSVLAGFILLLRRGKTT